MENKDEPMVDATNEVGEPDKMYQFNCDFEEDDMLNIYSKVFDATLSKKQLSLCKLICVMLDGDKDVKRLELPQIQNKEAMDLIIQFLIHHNGTDIPLTSDLYKKPRRDEDMKCLVDEWDANWMDSMGSDLIIIREMILIAHYLEIKSAMHLGCARLSVMEREEQREAKIEGKEREAKSLDQMYIEQLKERALKTCKRIPKDNLNYLQHPEEGILAEQIIEAQLKTMEQKEEVQQEEIPTESMTAMQALPETKMQTFPEETLPPKPKKQRGYKQKPAKKSVKMFV